MEHASPKTVLIVLLGAIGDVTRALPLAVRLKRAWPQTELSWAVEPRSADILRGHSSIDNLILFDRPRGFKAFLAFLREVKQRRFELVLDLQRHLKSGVTSFAAGAPRRVGFHRRNAKEFNWLFNTDFIPPVENLSLKLEHYQLFGDLLGLPKLEPLEFGLRFSHSELNAAEALLREAAEQSNVALGEPRRRAALILGSTWQSRLWPIAHYVQLVQLLERSEVTPLLVGSAADGRWAAEIERAVPGRCINLAGRTSLRQAAAVFSLCGAAIGPDSGPMHIAAAVGTRVVSLWGATSPKRSAPFGSTDLVLQSAVGCSACYRRVCPGLGTLCMDEISPDVVFAALEQALAKR